MDTLKVLWVDLRLIREEVSFDRYLSKDCTISHIRDAGEVVREIHERAPVLLCFEYDYPDVSSLSVLRQARCLFPLMPIIMLTEQHSEALAIWALRMQVSDFFVKPLQPQNLKTSAATILKQASLQKDTMAYPSQQSNISSNLIPMELRVQPYQKKKTHPAQSFIETHYHEKIYEEEVAQLCGMNVSTFSRSFKKEHGTTFRNYLIDYRINKAKELLKNPIAMVTDIAYTVGFQDPSYFARTFRRFVGMSPSRYHEDQKNSIKIEEPEAVSIINNSHNK